MAVAACRRGSRGRGCRAFWGDQPGTGRRDEIGYCAGERHTLRCDHANDLGELPDDLFSQLARKAKTRHLTKSQVVRESLEKGLDERPPAGAVSCYDLARDLAGTVKGLPKIWPTIRNTWKVSASEESPGWLDTGPLTNFGDFRPAPI